MGKLKENVNGTWVDIKQPWENVNGIWTKCKVVWEKIDGVWQKIWEGVRTLVIGDFETATLEDEGWTVNKYAAGTATLYSNWSTSGSQSVRFFKQPNIPGSANINKEIDLTEYNSLFFDHKVFTTNGGNMGVIINSETVAKCEKDTTNAVYSYPVDISSYSGTNELKFMMEHMAQSPLDWCVDNIILSTKNIWILYRYALLQTNEIIDQVVQGASYGTGSREFTSEGMDIISSSSGSDEHSEHHFVARDLNHSGFNKLKASFYIKEYSGDCRIGVGMSYNGMYAHYYRIVNLDKVEINSPDFYTQYVIELDIDKTRSINNFHVFAEAKNGGSINVVFTSMWLEE